MLNDDTDEDDDDFANYDEAAAEDELNNNNVMDVSLTVDNYDECTAVIKADLNYRSSLSKCKSTYKTLSTSHKHSIVKLVDQTFKLLKNNVNNLNITTEQLIRLSISITLSDLILIPGFQYLKHRDIRRYLKARQNQFNQQRRGPKINRELAAEVWGEVVICVFENIIPPNDIQLVSFY